MKHARTKSDLLVELEAAYQRINELEYREKQVESEQRYMLLFQKSTIPAVLLKLPEVVIADANEAAEKLTGYSREEILGKTAAELGLISHKQRTQDIETFQAAGELAENERQVFTKTGEERIVVSRTNRLEIAGQPYAITTLENVTERKLAKIKRDRLAERLDLATRSAKMGIWDWDIVKNEIVWDDQMYALYGLQPGEFGGAYEAWLHGLHPEDRDSSNEVSAAAVRGEREYDTEFRVRWPDGSVHWLKANGRVFRDKNGAPLRMVGVNYDITERKRAEEAIERTRNTLAEAQKIAHLGSFEYIAATQTTVWSEEEYRIYGLDPAGTSPEYNTMLQNCIHPDDAALLHETFTKAMLSNSVYELEHRIVRPDGSVRWVYDRAMPYLNERGEIIRYVGITLDITERKLMEDELRRSNAELEQFAYVASHDLQEPLRAMAGMVQLLQQRYKGKLDERADEYINHAVEASTRMQALINDLLTYSRVDRRGKPFELISLQKCVEAALKNLEVAVRESHARVTWGSLPTVRAESGQLVQVFQNLVGNAIKFRGGREPQIHIEGKRLEDAWQISVCDNGIGIEAQYFERIFQVFQRLHTRVEYPGTGIGLALCKKIIERHSGTIWVESQPGEGSTFHFTIPIRRKSDETQLQS